MKNAPACNADQSARTAPSYSTRSAISQIRAALERGECLTSQDALQRFGSSRLAAVIERLKHRDGLPIQSEIIEVYSPSGGAKRVSRYWITPPFGEVF